MEFSLCSLLIAASTHSLTRATADADAGDAMTPLNSTLSRQETGQDMFLMRQPTYKNEDFGKQAEKEDGYSNVVTWC